MGNEQDSVRELFGDSAFNPETGKLLHDQYRILAKLGQGGMGAVYQAQDCLNLNYVAIKRIMIQSNQKNLMERFRREYRLLRQLHHPNVVKALDFFQEQDTLFLVMEFVEGISLHKLIREHPHSLTLEQQLQIGRQIALAVAALNEANILHRDIKPPNIIVSDNRRDVKLVDLGISKNLEETASLTEHGIVLGTPSYLSPEQVQGESSDRSDIFSLGLTLYQFFLWQPHSPFHQENKLLILRNILQKTVPPLILQIPKNVSKLQHTIYQSLSDILQQALVKNPKRRLAHARELAEELALLFELASGEEMPTEARATNNAAKELMQALEEICLIDHHAPQNHRIKEFIIQSQIWANAEFEICSGWDLEHKRPALIRQIQSNQITAEAREKLQSRMIQEYYLLSDLDYAYLLKPYHLLENDGILYLIYPFIPSISLRHLIQNFAYSYTFLEQLKIMQQITGAVQYIHEKNIVIGNLHPENILIDGIHKVAYLQNLSVAIPQKTAKALTLDQAGKSGYWSPEQVKNQISITSDVFSLGVILHQFLSWQPHSPFAAYDHTTTLANIRELALPILAENLDIPEALIPVYQKIQQLIQQATNKNSQARLCIRDFQAELNKIVEEAERLASMPKRNEERPISQAIASAPIVPEENPPSEASEAITPAEEVQTPQTPPIEKAPSSPCADKALPSKFDKPEPISLLQLEKAPPISSTNPSPTLDTGNIAEPTPFSVQLEIQNAIHSPQIESPKPLPTQPETSKPPAQPETPKPPAQPETPKPPARSETLKPPPEAPKPPSKNIEQQVNSLLELQIQIDSETLIRPDEQAQQQALLKKRRHEQSSTPTLAQPPAIEEPLEVAKHKAEAQLAWNPELFQWQNVQRIFFCLNILLWTGFFLWIQLTFLKVVNLVFHLQHATTWWTYLLAFGFILAPTLCASLRNRNILWGAFGMFGSIPGVILWLWLEDRSFEHRLSQRFKSHPLLAYLRTKLWFYCFVFLFCVSVDAKAVLWPDHQKIGVLLFLLCLAIIILIHSRQKITFIVASLTTSLSAFPWPPFQVFWLWCFGSAGHDLRLRYAIEDMIQAIQHLKPLPRFVGLGSIRKIFEEDAILQREDDTRTRRWSIPRKELLECVLESLKDRNWWIRCQATYTLSTISHPEVDVDPILRKLLEDPNRWVKGIAAEAINIRIHLREYLQPQPGSSSISHQKGKIHGI